MHIVYIYPGRCEDEMQQLDSAMAEAADRIQDVSQNTADVTIARFYDTFAYIGKKIFFLMMEQT